MTVTLIRMAADWLRRGQSTVEYTSVLPLYKDLGVGGKVQGDVDKKL